MDRDTRVRGAKRLDTHALADLRVAYLAEMARLEPRLQLLPDVRERTEHAIPVWIDQEDRILLVAELPGAEETSGTLVGYATGVAAVWPPIFRNQHVGEVSEVYVDPARRGQGTGRRLLSLLSAGLQDLGAKVLRASVAAPNEISLHRFRSEGYRTLQYVLQRGLEEG
ncbi:MAG: N-acetyltransferase family protein [Planctomycetota bacterium]